MCAARKKSKLEFGFSQLCELAAGLESMMDLHESMIRRKENLTSHRQSLAACKTAMKTVQIGLKELAPINLIK